MIDLGSEHMEAIRSILSATVPDVDVLAYGSRVRGTARPFSDLDLALRGAQALPRRRMEDLRNALSESDLPFLVDVVDWHAITAEFRALINQQYEMVQRAR